MSAKFNSNVILQLTGLWSSRLTEEILNFEGGQNLLEMLWQGRTGGAKDFLQSSRDWPQAYKYYCLAVISCINADWQDAVGYFGKVHGVVNGPADVKRLVEICKFFSGKIGFWERIRGGVNLSELLNCFQYCSEVYAYLLWMKIYRHNEVNSRTRSDDEASIEKIIEAIWAENILLEHCHQAREYLINQLAKQNKKLTVQRLRILCEWLDKTLTNNDDTFSCGHNIKFWRLLASVFEKNGEYICACRSLELVTGGLWSSADCSRLVELYDLAGDTRKAFNHCCELATREKTGQKVLIKLLYLTEKHLRYLLNIKRYNEIRAVYLELRPLEDAFPVTEWENFLVRTSHLLEDSGCYFEAVAFYEALGRFKHNHPAYLAGIMKFYYRQGEYEQCYRKYSVEFLAENNFSDFAECGEVAIRSLLGMGNVKEAYQLALKYKQNTAIEKVQDVFEDALTQWTEELFAQDMDECISLVKEHYLQDRSKRIEELLLVLRKKRLTVMIKSGKYDRADDELVRLLRAYPNDRGIILLTSDMEEARGRRETAIRILEDYQLSSYSTETERRLLDLYFAQGWYSRALVTYKNLYGQSLINREELLYEIHSNICRSVFNEANNKREPELLNNALKCVNEAIADFPLDDNIEELRRKLYILFGDYYFGEGIYTGAIKYYQKSLPYIKDQNHCVRKLALCYTYLSQWQDAENWWLKLKDELEPGETTAYPELIKIYLKTKKFDRAFSVNNEYYKICGNINDYTAWREKIEIAAGFADNK